MRVLNVIALIGLVSSTLASVGEPCVGSDKRFADALKNVVLEGMKTIKQGPYGAICCEKKTANEGSSCKLVNKIDECYLGGKTVITDGSRASGTAQDLNQPVFSDCYFGEGSGAHKFYCNAKREFIDGAESLYGAEQLM